MLHNASSPPRRSPNDTGLWAVVCEYRRLIAESDGPEVLAEYRAFRDLVAAKVRGRFPVGRRVLVPRSHGGTIGTVDGYHGSEVDAVWVRLDVPAGHEMRRALVPAAELIDLNRE